MNRIVKIQHTSFNDSMCCLIWNKTKQTKHGWWTNVCSCVRYAWQYVNKSVELCVETLCKSSNDLNNLTSNLVLCSARIRSTVSCTRFMLDSQMMYWRYRRHTAVTQCRRLHIFINSNECILCTEPTTMTMRQHAVRDYTCNKTNQRHQSFRLYIKRATVYCVLYTSI